MNEHPMRDIPTTTVITFGVMYTEEEPHPSGLPAFGKGWWEVEGVNREQARTIVHALTDSQYAFAYAPDSKHFTAERYPMGCTLRITVDVCRGVKL